MRYAYHVAPAEARGYIERHGLIASGPNPRWAKYGLTVQPAGVYAWTRIARARTYAEDFARLVRDAVHGASLIWEVDLTGLDVKSDPLLWAQGAVYVPESVGPERLAVVR